MIKVQKIDLNSQTHYHTHTQTCETVWWLTDIYCDLTNHRKLAASHSEGKGTVTWFYVNVITTLSVCVYIRVVITWSVSLYTAAQDGRSFELHFRLSTKLYGGTRRNLKLYFRFQIFLRAARNTKTLWWHNHTHYAGRSALLQTQPRSYTDMYGDHSHIPCKQWSWTISQT